MLQLPSSELMRTMAHIGALLQCSGYCSFPPKAAIVGISPFIWTMAHTGALLQCSSGVECAEVEVPREKRQLYNMLCHLSIVW